MCNTTGLFLQNSFGSIAPFHKTDLTASENPKIQDKNPKIGGRHLL